MRRSTWVPRYYLGGANTAVAGRRVHTKVQYLGTIPCTASSIHCVDPRLRKLHDGAPRPTTSKPAAILTTRFTTIAVLSHCHIQALIRHKGSVFVLLLLAGALHTWHQQLDSIAHSPAPTELVQSS